MRGMVIHMEEAKLQTLEQIKAFLDGTSEVAFRVPKEGRNPFIERVLGIQRKNTAVFPTHHFVPITLADQATPCEGAEGALAYLGLHAGDGGCQTACKTFQIRGGNSVQ